MNKEEREMMRELCEALGRKEVVPDIWEGPAPKRERWSTELPSIYHPFAVQYYLDPNTWETAGLITAALAPRLDAENQSDGPTGWVLTDLGHEGWLAQISWWHHDGPIPESDATAPSLPQAICQCALIWLSKGPSITRDPVDRNEIARLRGLLAEAAAYVTQYGDYRKDAHYRRRFRAAAEGKPEPEDPYADEEE